jgi:hypothetical protein
MPKGRFQPLRVEDGPFGFVEVVYRKPLVPGPAA